MSAYDWGRGAGTGRHDDRAGRREWNATRGVGSPVTVPPPEPEPTSGRRRPGRAKPKAAPGGAADLWLPLGPMVVLGGQATGDPRVTGRVRDIRVEPTNGLRAYAATAGGGIWYTDDGGTTWRALGGWRSADTDAAATLANPLVSGALWVDFGRTGAGADHPPGDQVWVGTGEGIPFPSGIPGHRLLGVGVLHATNPSTRPETDPVFSAEATNLLGQSVMRLARQPGGSGLVAATSKGLVERPAGAGPHLTWPAAAGFPAANGKPLLCLDAVWTAPVGDQPGRLWVAARRANWNVEVWYRADGTTTFNRVTLPPGTGAPAPSTNMALAAGPGGSQVWALGDAPPPTAPAPPSARLWRIDATAATPAGVLVRDGPTLWDTSLISQSKIAVAVDPANGARVALAGTWFSGPTSPDGASVFLGVVTNPSAGVFRYPAGSHVGAEVHPDVLAIRFTDDGNQVWIACDGGVYVSTQGGAAGTFVARNTGLAVSEPGFVACHPTNDTAVMAGVQDNATQRRVGEGLWRWESGGDGGGVAFDQVQTERYVAQYLRAHWGNGTTPPRPPVRVGPQAGWSDEDSKAEFYSGGATVANGDVNQLAIGTNRVWYTENWGTNWVTLPTATDPRAGQRPGAPAPPAAPANNQDVLPDGAVVRALRWAGADRLWVLCARSLHRLDRSAGVWQPLANVSLASVFHPAKKTDVAQSDTANDIAVHDPARGTHGSVYLALLGDLATAEDDQLWWYDGTSAWHRTGLRGAVKAAALAVVVDPGDPSAVYVGTTIGVFRSRLSFAGTSPRWAPWARVDNGLPDVAVQDLAVFSRGPIRLLRAATQARGVWELDLTGPVADRSFLRVHPYDSRRLPTTALAAPFEPRIPDPSNPGATISTDYPWHASPDIRVHPKLGAMAPPGSLPWTRTTAWTPAADPVRSWRLWRFQVALRAMDRRSEATGAWGNEFERVLRANAVPTPSGQPTITPEFWTSVVSGAAADRLPWDTPEPTEADLVEYLPSLPEVGQPDRPSMDLPRGVVTVHVLVHHRGFPVQRAADVKVTLLWRRVPGWSSKASADWLPGNVGWHTMVTTLLTDGTVPALPTGWNLADPADPVRSPTADVAAGLPRTVSFDVDLGGSAVPPGSLVLLAAVVHSPRDAVGLANVPLRRLTLDRRHVAVRSLRVR